MADNSTNPTTAHVSRDVTVKSHENISGHHTDFTSDRDVTMSGEFDDRVMQLLNGVLQDREARENKRADKRNFNRMLTLFGALAIGLVVTFCLTTPGIVPASMKFLTPYTFVITIVLDSGLALYGYIKKY